MKILSVDLAAVFSAAVVRDESGEVHEQFDSGDMSPFAFLSRVARVALECDYVLIEDVPYNPNYTQAMVKPVLRLQGIIFALCHRSLDKIAFVSPSTWMASFPGVQRAQKGLTKTQADASRIEAARVHAAGLGYTPPNLVQQYIDSLPEGTRVLKKNTNPLEKSMTDYVSAYLMSEWGIRTITKFGWDGLLGLSNVEPALI